MLLTEPPDVQGDPLCAAATSPLVRRGDGEADLSHKAL